MINNTTIKEDFFCGLTGKTKLIPPMQDDGSFSHITNSNNLTSDDIQRKIRVLRASIKISLDEVENLLEIWENLE